MSNMGNFIKEKAKIANEDIEKEFTKSEGIKFLSAYGCQDCMCLVNGAVVSEMQAINVDYVRKKIEGSAAFFHATNDKLLRLLLSASSLKMTFANEYGCKMEINFKGIKTTELKTLFNIDNSVFTYDYEMNFEDFSVYGN